MKRLLALILIFMLIPQLSFASQATDLKILMNEYHYFLTVEWDQEDRVVFENKTAEFESSIDELIDQGFSYKDMGDIPEELKTLSYRDREIVKNRLLNHVTYSKGASWNGEILAPAIIIGITAVAIVAFIRYAVKKNRAFNECVEFHGGDEQSCIDR